MSLPSTLPLRRAVPSCGKQSFRLVPRARRAVLVCALLPLIWSGARAQQPITGAPQVVAGAATFTQNGNTRTITQQSGAAIIHWNDLSVNAGDLLRFVQPGADSAVLNRVLGGQPSLLNGQLQANGSVYLINPKGVMVGPQGRIDVGAFFASTLDVSDDDFLRRGQTLRFAGDSSAGVHNLGRITASEGDVMLVAYTVRNAGTINAAKGVAGLAAGSEVYYTHQGDQRIAVQSGLSASGLENGVENTGLVQAAQAELKAAGGNIYSLAVNQAGVVRATGVETKNGRVLLVADGGDVEVSGEISAQNANGSGGQILVGGGFQGKDGTVANAANTVVTASAKLDASATGANAHGGEVIVWADKATQFAGHVAARGGSASGNGGFLEVSGKRWLNFTGTADTTAANGKRGTLLLDPDAIIISTASNQNVAGQGGFFQAEAVPSYLNNALLNDILAVSDVEIRTGDAVAGPAGFNGIAVNADLTWNATTNLKLVSGDTIAVNANINGGANGTLTLMPGSVSSADNSTGAITLASGNSITVNTLTIEKSPLASTNGANIGTVNLAGTVNAATVNLVRTSGGVQGDVLITNAANQIGTLRGTDAAGAISGALRVTDSTGGLTVGGDLSGVGGAVEIVTTGNLTLASGAVVKNTGASDLVLASRSGNFINNAGATAVEASGAGRYLIYSDLPVGTTRGGLTGANTYNKTYAANAPASITATGDRFLFNFAPSLTLTLDNVSRAYGAANPTFTYTVSGLQVGDTVSSVGLTGAPAVTSTATASTGVGTATISATVGTLQSEAGYGFSFAPGTLTITRAPLTITANDFTRAYGVANPSFTASYAGLVNGDTSAVVSGLTFGTTATPSSGVGSYAITLSGGTAANYALTLAPGTLTVNPASLTVTANDFTRLYGAPNPTFTANLAGLVNGDTASVLSGLSLTTTATTTSNVGTYAINAAGATAPNYALTFAPGTLTIDRAPLTIAANNASRLFGAANPAFTALFNGLVNGDNSSVVSGLALATTANINSAVGDYAITASGATATNYAISYQPGVLTIANALLTITANDFTRTYGAANPAFTASYAGFTGGDTAAVVTGLQFSTAATLTSGVGTYTLTPFGATAANYGINYVPGSLAITPAALTIRANDTARTYGAANPTFTGTFTGLVAGDTAANISGLQFTTSASAVSGVGSYSINASGATNANYTITHQPGILTIDPAALTVTADSFARTYGTDNPALTANYSGFVNGENFTVVSGLSVATSATSASNVGTYAINASGVTASNYAITYVPGTATINPATLTIRADSFTRTYGEALPTFTASFSGLVNGDTAATVSGLQLNSAATSLAGVGAYAITPSGGSASNYTIDYVDGSLSIAPAFLLVRPNDAARLYGAANPAFTANITGFVHGDTASVVSGLTINSAASVTSDVGTYDIVGSGATAANYQFGYTPGTLTVSRASLTAIANDATRTYGAADPTFTSRFTGLLNGDTAAVVTGLTYTTPATATSGVGSYSLLPSGGTATNYTITAYQPGALAITPASVTVTPNTATRGYGDANPVFTASFAGLMNGETSSVLTAQPTFTTPADLTSNVGNYAINASGAAAANYTFTYNPGTLSVTPAVLAVRADNLVRNYGDANPTFTYSVSGLKNGDTADGRFFIFTLGSTAAPNSNVGNYAIQLTGNDTPNDNYTAFFAPGTLTVQPRALTITANPATRQYGLANPAFSASFAGLASFDSSSVITNLGFTSAATPATGVGTVGVVPTSSANANYAITYQPGQLTITPAPLSVLAGGNVSRTYGDANPTFASFVTAGTLYNGDTLSSIGATATTTALPTSNVGTYAITPAITSPNYTLTPVAGSLTILPAIIDVSLGAVNRIYGNANPAAVPAIIGGLKFSEDAASLLAFNFAATASAPVGAYAVTAASTSANYQIRTLTPGTVNVLPRPVTVTIENASRNYGDLNPAFTARVGGLGLAAGDSVNALLSDSIATTLATAISNVGTYALNAATVANPNYAATYINGSLLVRPRPITLTGLDLTRFYYDLNPSLFYTVGGAGLASFDSLSAVLTSPGIVPDQNANVGTYTFTPQLAANSNYAVSVGRLPTLTIAPRPVTLAVNSLSLGLGETVPPFSVTASNLPSITNVATEFPGLTFSTGPVPALPGTFSFGDTITVAGVTTTRLQITASGFGNPNYAVTTTPGLLTTTVAVDETARPGGMLVVPDKKPLVVETFDVTAPVKLAAPLSDPYYRPVLAAGVNYIFDEVRDGNLKFKRALTDAGFPIDLEGGVDAFLADIATNSVKQALLTGALATLVTEEVLKEPSARSSVLAPLVATTMEAARKAKLAQETEAVAKYDAWLAAERAGPASLDVMMTGGDNVPNFLGEARAAHNAIAVVSVVGAGAGSFVVMSTLTAAIPATVATFGSTTSGAVGSILFGATSAASGASSTAGLAAGPVGAAVVVVTGSIMRGLDIKKSEDNRRDLEQARVSVNSGLLPAIDLNDKEDLATFGSAFYGVVGLTGFGGG